jgi:hypothetical protein
VAAAEELAWSKAATGGGAPTGTRAHRQRDLWTGGGGKRLKELVARVSQWWAV